VSTFSTRAISTKLTRNIVDMILICSRQRAGTLWGLLRDNEIESQDDIMMMVEDEDIGEVMIRKEIITEKFGNYDLQGNLELLCKIHH